MNNATFTLDPEYAIKHFTKFNFKGSKRFSGLFLIEMFRTEIEYNKPVYVGTSVLDLWKIKHDGFPLKRCPSEFWKQLYNLLYTDIDSLIYIQFSIMIYMNGLKKIKYVLILSESIRTEFKDNTNKKGVGH